jgi:hypothetical protein
MSFRGPKALNDSLLVLLRGRRRYDINLFDPKALARESRSKQIWPVIFVRLVRNLFRHFLEPVSGR